MRLGLLESSLRRFEAMQVCLWEKPTRVEERTTERDEPPEIGQFNSRRYISFETHDLLNKASDAIVKLDSASTFERFQEGLIYRCEWW